MRRHLAESPRAGRQQGQAGSAGCVGGLFMSGDPADAGSSIRSCRSSTWRSSVHVALAGPLLATPRRWHLPVVLGELLAGAVLGASGLGFLDASDPTFTFLGNCGFVLVMFVAGTHVPVRDPRLRPPCAPALVRALVVGVAARRPRVRRRPARRHPPRPALRRADGVVLGRAGPADRRLAGAAGPRRRRPAPAGRRSPTPSASCCCRWSSTPTTSLRAALGAVAVLVAGGVLFLALRAVERSGVRRPRARASRRTGSSPSSCG